MNIFEKASRKNLLIDTSVGMISVNDLWDLPLTTKTPSRQLSLNEVAKDINKEVQAYTEENFVPLAGTAINAKHSDALLALNIVKHVIAVKIEARDMAASAVIKRQKKDKIMEAILNKESANLAEASMDELKAMLNDL